MARQFWMNIVSLKDHFEYLNLFLWIIRNDQIKNWTVIDTQRTSLSCWLVRVSSMQTQMTPQKNATMDVCVLVWVFVFVWFSSESSNFFGKITRFCSMSQTDLHYCFCVHMPLFAVHFGPRFPLDFLPLKKYLYLSKIGLVKCFKYNSTTFAHRRYLVEWEMNQSIPMEHISP